MPALTNNPSPDKYGVLTIKDRAGNHVRDVRLTAEELVLVRTDREYFAQMTGMTMERDYFCADVLVDSDSPRSFRLSADEVESWLAVKGAPPRVAVSELKDTTWTIRSRCSTRGFAIDVNEFEVEDGPEGKKRLHVCYDAGVSRNMIRPKFLWFNPDEWDGNEKEPTVLAGVLEKVVFPPGPVVVAIVAGQMEVV